MRSPPSSSLSSELVKNKRSSYLKSKPKPSPVYFSLLGFLNALDIVLAGLNLPENVKKLTIDFPLVMFC